METLRKLCLAVPENISPDQKRSIVNLVRTSPALHQYEVDVLEFPHSYGALFNKRLTNDFIEKVHKYRTFAFLAFPDGGIHVVHGKAIIDKWHHDRNSCVYEISMSGTVTPQDPLQLCGRFQPAEVTDNHLWEMEHYMRPLIM